MPENKKNNQYAFALVAIVAIVAIVACFLLVKPKDVTRTVIPIKTQTAQTTAQTAPPEILAALDEADKTNVVGAARYKADCGPTVKYQCDSVVSVCNSEPGVYARCENVPISPTGGYAGLAFYCSCDGSWGVTCCYNFR